MNKRKCIIGSRESALAVVQSRMVLGYLQEHCPELEVELLTMKTTGDKILDRRLDQIGGKGLFVKELDKALMDRRSDLSVHSMKDLPMEVAEDLPLVGCSRREDPRDVLVLPEGAKEMDFSKPIGTSSLRRSLQLRELFPEAGQAYVSKSEALRGDDIGIENAEPEVIRRAIEAAGRTLTEQRSEFKESDMIFYGLAADPEAKARRDYAGKKLGIGYGNAKAFLKRLNHYGITREELEASLPAEDELRQI